MHTDINVFIRTNMPSEPERYGFQQSWPPPQPHRLNEFHGCIRNSADIVTVNNNTANAVRLCISRNTVAGLAKLNMKMAGKKVIFDNEQHRQSINRREI